MRKLLLATAFVVASASAQAQTIDVGSILSANGISIGKGSQPQAGMSPNAGSQGGPSAAGLGQGPANSQRQAARARQPRESAQETRARNIAAKYGISW
ncbi:MULTISPECIES: hypothetical protein [unclassified Bradyrhizobium]|uniref:hypothetical protein n=1 Tax=unclassified Bradyrhizobium TaxID=2631580 RepID=UPI0028EA9575|nr:MULTISPECIES: hypothetical protein [unclassified Bradyrhizobium]